MKRQNKPKNRTKRRNLFTDIIENAVGTGSPETSIPSEQMTRNVGLPTNEESILSKIASNLKSNATEIAREAGKAVLGVITPTLAHERTRVPYHISHPTPSLAGDRAPHEQITHREIEKKIKRFKQPTESHATVPTPGLTPPTTSHVTHYELKVPISDEPVQGVIYKPRPKQIAHDEFVREHPDIMVGAPTRQNLQKGIGARDENIQYTPAPGNTFDPSVKDSSSKAVTVYQPPLPPIEQIRQVMPPKVLVPDNVDTETILRYLNKPIYTKGQPNMKNIVTKANIAAQASFMNLKKYNK